MSGGNLEFDIDINLLDLENLEFTGIENFYHLLKCIICLKVYRYPVALECG